MISSDTICAIATPSGRGGVGIVRLSGPDSFAVVERVSGALPPLRQVGLRTFRDAAGESIDSGLVLTFKAPASFTGEDVVELHTHGSPVVLELLMTALVQGGARRARPGEFSERAFLNDRLDLAQAEAIADLINASSAQAARAAHRSLAGALSNAADALAGELTRLRVWVEAALDFPDEDVDFLADGQVLGRCQSLQAQLAALRRKADSGRLLNDGIRVAIIGPPNAGKSSLLNALSQRDAAIVTDIPGTTRDVLTETVSIAGLAITLADTAGLRATDDQVEAEGVRRAEREMHAADLVFWVIDASAASPRPPSGLGESVPFIRIVNKIDLLGESPRRDEQGVHVSIRSGLGLDLLADCVRDRLGLSGEQHGEFSARARHVEALDRAAEHLERGTAELEASGSGELLAEELRLAADSLGEISGRMSSDELLGEIFSSFCIGK